MHRHRMQPLPRLKSYRILERGRLSDRPIRTPWSRVKGIRPVLFARGPSGDELSGTEAIFERTFTPLECFLGDFFLFSFFPF